MSWLSVLSEPIEVLLILSCRSIIRLLSLVAIQVLELVVFEPCLLAMIAEVHSTSVKVVSQSEMFHSSVSSVDTVVAAAAD